MVGLMDKHSFPKKTHFLYLLRVVLFSLMLEFFHGFFMQPLI